MSNREFAKGACQFCGSHIEFPVSGIGMTINCPNCAQSIVLEVAEPVSGDQASPFFTADFAGAFNGTIRPQRVSFLYQLGLLLVTAVMLVLPVIYLALIAGAVWTVYWFATHFFFLMQSLQGGARFYVIKAFFYIGTLFAGIVAVFFLFKPLFAGRPRGAEPLSIDPAVERDLYTFIAKICDLVGAPMPKRICVDCQLNASASFRRGMRSFLGNDLVLTIGLPLVAGMDTRQLAGIIAHEFGHFTQGFGMRLSYVIRSINFWFGRVVYERDAWDVWLQETAFQTEDWKASFIVGCAQLAVTASRQILKLLMIFGHVVSCFLLKQMEYNADSYEIQVAGSAGFESAMLRLAVLAEATNRAYKEMRTVWNNGRQLPDSFPAYLVRHEATLPPEVRQRIEDTAGLVTAGIFDTHPSKADRIRRARQADEPGIFHIEAPARNLFANFDVIARQVTHLHFEDDLGIVFDPSMLKPVMAADAVQREAAPAPAVPQRKFHVPQRPEE